MELACTLKSFVYGLHINLTSAFMYSNENYFHQTFPKLCTFNFIHFQIYFKSNNISAGKNIYKMSRFEVKI